MLHITRSVRTHYIALLTSLIVTSWATCACQREAESPVHAETQESREQVAQPRLITVRDDSESLLFTYRDLKGHEQSATSIKEIPQEVRAHVRVIDLTRSPSERKSLDFLQVFDLRAPNANGDYPGRLLSRNQLEDELMRASAPAPKSAPAKTARQQPEIILYSTAWCGYCKKARSFLKRKRLKFTERDIEKDGAAARELARKSKRAGIQMGGVPVIDVGGKLMQGFDAKRLISMVKRAQK